jgi:hypothetical protein
MYYTLGAGARLYRVTSPNTAWPTLLRGEGAYFTHGGRYNRAGQATVYCSEDPVVVITEAAFYRALEWQYRISVQQFHPMTYPLVSDHTLWCFTLDPPGANQARPESVKAPAVRMRKKYNFQPFQLALFVMDPSIQVPYPNRATLVDQWPLRLEFEQAKPRQPVSGTTVEIDWTAPRFQLGPAGHAPLPAYAGRPRAVAYAMAPQWYPIEIRYA